MKIPNPEICTRLEKEKNIWLATVRPDGRPHLVPVWFIWQDQTVYICIFSGSVKYRNIMQNGSVVLSLEDGSTPVICEGRAENVDKPWPTEIVRWFKEKYDWEIESDEEYDALVLVNPVKWLSW